MWRVSFSLQFVSGCVCVFVCVCQWTKFQPNECTNLDMVFAKWVASRNGSDPWVEGKSHSDIYIFFQWLSMIICILLQSTVWFNRVKQRQPRLVLGRVIVSVCEFLVMVVQLRLKSRSLALIFWRQDEFPLGINLVQFSNFHFFLFFGNFPTLYLSSLMSDRNEIQYVA